MHWSSAADTHRGNTRPSNQDSVFCSAEQQLWAVADGMGGHHLGEYASQAITDALSHAQLGGCLSECVDEVEDLLLDLNEHLRQYAQAQCNGDTIGSTVVACIVRGTTGVALWAGDSRLYRVRDDSIVQITRDHNPISDLYDSGSVTEEEVLTADTHIVTRAVGGQRDLHLDVAVFDLQKQDTLLLCSDGLYREVSRDVLVDALSCDVEAAVSDLMYKCLAGTAHDNVSLVVAKAEASSP